MKWTINFSLPLLEAQKHRTLLKMHHFVQYKCENMTVLYTRFTFKPLNNNRF